MRPESKALADAVRACHHCQTCMGSRYLNMEHGDGTMTREPCVCLFRLEDAREDFVVFWANHVPTNSVLEDFLEEQETIKCFDCEQIFTKSESVAMETNPDLRQCFECHKNSAATRKADQLINHWKLHCQVAHLAGSTFDLNEDFTFIECCADGCKWTAEISRGWLLVDGGAA